VDLTQATKHLNEAPKDDDDDDDDDDDVLSVTNASK